MSEDTVRRLLTALNDATDRIEALEAERHESIAVVGIACRFPSADGPAAFWRVLRQGVDAITPVPSDRWDVDRYYSPDPDTPGTMYTRHGGFVDGVDMFDPQFFEISPREAASLDPQQRLLLELTWHAFEDAQLSREAVTGSSTGVFVGVTNNDYERVLRRYGDETAIDAYFSSGNTLNAAAGRLAYTFGLRGPAVAVDTACSSSLVAAHLACQALRSGQCERAVVAGVNLILSPEGTIAISRGRMVAPDGRCKTFDASADGYVRGEGAGVLILRRLTDAVAGDEHPRAVICGSAVNQNGPSGGLTVPSGPAQQALIRAALEDARLEPGDIDYVEAHGTGTSLGDPIEAVALGAVFGGTKTRDTPLRVGSVKTNIGHLESAAGMAGLIKVILSTEHGELPPHLHFRTPSPHIPWDQIPLRVVTKLEPWNTTPRHAGVSSFGASGTNAHLVIAPPPEQLFRRDDAPGREQLIVLSSPEKDGLRDQAEALAGYLEQTDDALDDISVAMTAGRTHHRHRAAFVAANTGQAAEQLRELLAGRVTGVRQGRVPAGEPEKLAGLFTGQGAQHARMGRALYEENAHFRAVIDRCDAVLRDMGLALVDTIFGGTDDWTQTTAATQPALFGLEVALAELYRSWGITLDAVLGHSIGEYAAACVAGVFELEDGVRLIAARGRLMQDAPGEGAMVAVLAGDDEVGDVIAGVDQVVIAARNSPRNVVISGDRAAVAGVMTELDRRGLTAVSLNVAHAFHSTLMTPVVDELRRVAGSVRFRAPRIPIVSNVTGDLIGEEIATAGYWCEQVVRPVLFARGLDVLRRAGYDTFLELGPHPVLSEIAGEAESGNGAVWIPSLRRGRPEWEGVLDSVAALHVRGATVDWRQLDVRSARGTARPPGYQFQRRRCWVDDSVGRGTPVKAVGVSSGPGPRDLGSLLGQRLLLPGTTTHRYQGDLGPVSHPFLLHHRVHGQVVLPAAGFVTLALDAATEVLGAGPVALEDLVFERPLVLSDSGSTVVQVVIEPDQEHGYRFRVYSRATETEWVAHAGGRLSRQTAVPGNEVPTPVASVTRVEAGTYYEACRRQGVDFGPAFQVLTDLRTLGSDASESKVKLSARWPAGSGLLHTALLDGAFQTVGPAIADRAVGRALVPFSIDRIRVYRSPADGVHVRAQVLDGVHRAGWSADLTVWDDLGVVAAVEGLALRQAAEPVSRPGAAADPVFAISWQRLPEEQREPSTSQVPGPDGACVIVADRGGVGRAMAERLGAHGIGVTLIEPPVRADSHGDGSGAEFVRRALTASSGTPRPSQLMYLRALDVTETAWVDTGTLQRDVRAMSSGLLDLLAVVGADGVVPRLWLATRGAQPLGPGLTTAGCLQAMMWGMGRTLALEQHELRPVRVDLDPGSGTVADMADALTRELVLRWAEPNEVLEGEDEVALRGGQRFVPRLTPHAGASTPGPSVPFGGIRADRVYVITGGLGGLGLLTAGWLVEGGARHVALLSRRDPATAERDGLVTAWRASGVEIRLFQCDVADAGALTDVLNEARASAPIGGVFHAAGVVADGLLTGQTWSRFREILPAKVIGAAHLDRLTATDPLDCFVLYSSTASVLGSPAQGNYAAANAVLDALAWRRRAAGRPALTLNWGAWSGVGLAAGGDTSARARAAGLGVLDPHHALRMLGRMLREGAVQVTVAPVEWNVWAARLPGAAPGLLRSLVGRGEPAVSTHGVDRALVDRLRTASGGARSAEVTAYVVARLAEVLDLEPDRLEPDRALDTLGLDSLMAVELRSRFRRDLGAEVSLTVLLSDDRVDALAVHLAAALETRTGDEPESATTAGDGENAREALALVDEMTDEEVDAMLAGLEPEVGDRAGEPGRDPEGDGTDESPGGAR